MAPEIWSIRLLRLDFWSFEVATEAALPPLPSLRPQGNLARTEFIKPTLAATGSATACVGPSLGKQQCQEHARAETFGPAVGARGPIANACPKLDRLLVDVKKLQDLKIDRNRPFVGLPIVGAFGVEHEGPGILGGVGDEGLKESGVDLYAIVVAGK